MLNTRNFTDLDFGFKINPIKHQLILSNDEQAILRALRNVIMTNHYEIPFNSKFGSNVRQLLFDPVNNFTAQIIKREISDNIKNFEPRVNLLNVKINADIQNHKYEVSIYFKIINSEKPLVLNFSLNRLR